MRKFICILISFIFLFSFSSAAFADGQPDVSQQVIVCFDMINDIFYDPEFGQSVILNYLCEKPFVVIESNPGAADRINASLDAYFESYLPYSEGVSTDIDMETYMLSVAEDYYAGGNSLDYFPFSFSHRAYVSRCDDNVISFMFITYAKDVDEPVTSYLSLYFDAETGEQIEENAAKSIAANDASSSGSLSLGTESLSNYNIIDYCELSDDDVFTYAYVDGTLYNVKLTSVVYYGQYLDKQQHWYCNYMTDSALQIKAPLNLDNPSYCLKASFSLNTDSDCEIFF